MPRIITRISLFVLLALFTASVSASKTPAEAYLEFHAVLKQSFSDEAIWPYYVQSARAEFEKNFPPALRGRAFYIMKSSAPAAVKIDQEIIQGETATLMLVPASSGQANRGKAIMRMEDGIWKVEQLTWQAP